MSELKFEWDPKKNEINKEKHHVSFEEAQTVFYNEEAKMIDAPEAGNILVKRGRFMKEEYDFSNARKNPYTQKLKKQITINIDSDTIQFFKDMASSSGIPYQTLINLYLSDCAANNRQLHMSWN